ncbi:uncharacterized protein LOC122501047 [Leptopilina heterotoma]|uniref:uncharacterized protein LOC122501047 n=1 Tax=Leptopilina heterotoma TaxID=63436 RepID=UPI001CA7D2F8|nr:uncharacterized protein LOC122501047 [Leptopilina heterotoma]
MRAFLLVSLLVALILVADSNPIAGSNKKAKRGVSFFPRGYDIYGVIPAFTSTWNPTNYEQSAWDSSLNSDLALGQIQLHSTHNIALQALNDPHPGTPSIVYSPEILRSVQQAKEANYNVLVAQHRVEEAKQATILQQRLAIAREAAAREAAHRSAEISAHAQEEARASAKQLVALQQKLATLKDSVAAAQRVAAAREAAAAAAIQRNAADTAAELRKQDVDKQITTSEREAKARDLIAAKENAIANALQNSATGKPAHRPWG